MDAQEGAACSFLLDASPIVAGGDASYPALLRAAINGEDECTESFPGAEMTAPEDGSPGWPASRTAGFIEASRASQAGDGPELLRPGAPSRQHKKRRRERDREILSRGYRPSAKNAQKYLNLAEAVKTSLDAFKLPAASGAYTALNKPTPLKPSEVPSVEKLIEQDGFQYIACGENGVPSRAPRPIIDQSNTIIGVCAGKPQDTAYDQEVQDLFSIIAEESCSDTFSKGELNHKRGDFPAVNFGFTLPNGFKHPINLDHSRHKEKIDRISSSPGFKRISAFQNAAFAFWNPGIYEYQKSRIELLLAHSRNLQRTSPKTIFPTTACNFRNVCCYKHRDTQNCPFGWCAITALGDFDHTQGGHVILWELKLIIELPRGYTLLIPSATITHSNTPAADGDVRVSITQYCAGSLFRYVDNGFRTDKLLLAEDKERYDQNQVLKEKRWGMSLGLLSTIQGLKNRKIPTLPAYY